MKKGKQFFKKHYKALIALAAVALIALLLFARGGTAADRMLQTAVSTQTIVNYNRFVGNVQPASERNVLAKASAEVLEVHVSRGDTVKEGDVIAVLDTGDAEYNIALKEATIAATETTNAYSIREAQRSYDNYQEALNAGLNSSLQSAANQRENAAAALQSAQEALAGAESDINSGKNQATASAKASMEQAGNAADTAQSAYQQAASALSAKQAAVKAIKEQIAALDATSMGDPIDPTAGGDPTDPAGSGAGTGDDTAESEERARLQDQLAAAEAELSAATQSANAALQSVQEATRAYESARDQFAIAKENAIENLQNEVAAAERSYRQAAANYDATELQTRQQLGTYAENAQRSRATANTTASRLELENLKEGLEDYAILAPCDGTVRDVNLQVGDLATNGMTAAVISDFNVMEIAIKIDEYSVLNVKEGDAVSVFIDASGKEYTGEMVWIADGATIENGVSYFEATVRFTRDEDVRGGMSAEVRLVTVDRKGVDAVPVDALHYRDDNTVYVFTADENGALMERDVLIGASDGIYVEITDGLSNGETVFMEEQTAGVTVPQGGGFRGGE